MASVLHRDLPDAEIHEPKGAGTATAGHVLTADGVGGTSFQPAGGGGAIFGTELNQAASEAVSTTTSTTFQQKLTMSVTVPAGTYILHWNYMWNHDNGSNDFEARIQQDNSTDIMFHKQEPKDVAGTFGATGTSQRHTASGWVPLTLAVGTFTFDLDWRTDVAGDESSIWEARFMLYRVV